MRIPLFMGALSLGLAPQIASAAAANYYKGETLYQFCESSNTAQSAFCLGYVMAAVDQDELMRAQASKVSCLPDDLPKPETVVDVVKSYLRRHPEDRHYPASGVVHLSLVEAYRLCKD